MLLDHLCVHNDEESVFKNITYVLCLPGAYNLIKETEPPPQKKVTKVYYRYEKSWSMAVNDHLSNALYKKNCKSRKEAEKSPVRFTQEG